MKVILVKLTDETRKVRVLEHPRQNGSSEFVHIFDDEAVALGTPGYDVDNLGLFKHPRFRETLGDSGLKFQYTLVQFFDEVTCCASFARFLSGIGQLTVRLALEFILYDRDRFLGGGDGASGGVAGGGGIEGCDGGEGFGVMNGAERRV